MSYQVLARKWRPKNFAELVGQQHVLKALVHALDQGRLHHAYLFTGTRGVGKTTIGRIMAKCLNCEQGISSTPCEQCNACINLSQGRYVDMLEIDAASRTKVEDTRELLDNVPYAPSVGRYKIYLIDEVHMLSGHSFNALLKTLEEPPPHVIFLLATTDPKKLPATVLSRCLQFNLKNLTPEQITEHLQHILSVEKIIFENNGLQQLARAAQGSLRDALSLLDQAIAYGDGQVTESAVTGMLGTITPQLLNALMMALQTKDAQQIMTAIATLAEQGTDFNQALEEILNLLHQTAVAIAVPDILLQASVSLPQIELIKTLSQHLSANEVQLYYQIALIGRRDLALAPSPRSGFEMILLRMLAFAPTQAITTVSKPEPQKSPIKSAATPLITATPIISPIKADIKSDATDFNTVTTTMPSPANSDTTNWANLFNQLKLTGLSQVLASHCQLLELTETSARFELDPAHATLFNVKYQERIASSLSEHLGRPLQVQIHIAKQKTLATPAFLQQQQLQQQQAEALATVKKDPTVQALEQLFDAKINLDSLITGNTTNEPE